MKPQLGLFVYIIMAHDFIITGIPRSGTSLLCYLLNSCPNTIALNEPTNHILHQVQDILDREEIIAALRMFFISSRENLLCHRAAVSKNYQGIIPDNLYSHKCNKNRERRQLPITIDFVQFNKHLSENFTLCIKDTLVFTALLPELSQVMPCFALIRNPLAILASWHDIDIPLGKEYFGTYAELDTSLIHLLNQANTVLKRQLIILSWFYKQYLQHLSPEQIIRYEDLVSHPSKVAIKFNSHLSDKKLTSYNNNYSKTSLKMLAPYLLHNDGYYWEYYSEDDILSLL